MSTTLPLPAPGLDPAAEARGYSAAVRAELADLPVEVVEELTGGLEADLAELAAETSTPLLDRLGSPRSYADELRSSAGLPGPGAGAAATPERAGLWARATAGAREDVQHAVVHLRSRRWWPGFVERAQLVRPAWWLVRGAVGAWLVVRVFFGGGAGLGGSLLVVAGAVASLELGRRRLAVRWQRSLLVAGNVLAVLVLPFAVSSLTSSYPVYVDAGYASSDSSGAAEMSRGVWSDGQVVTNIYPYDAQGQPLTGVQLLDDYGRPLVTSTGDKSDWSGAEASPLVPFVAVDGALRWNAYPLRAQSGVAGAVPTTPPLPEPTLPPLLGTGTGAGAPSAAPTPTAPAVAPVATEPAVEGALVP